MRGSAQIGSGYIVQAITAGGLIRVVFSLISAAGQYYFGHLCPIFMDLGTTFWVRILLSRQLFKLGPFPCLFLLKPFEIFYRPWGLNPDRLVHTNCFAKTLKRCKFVRWSETPKYDCIIILGSKCYYTENLTLGNPGSSLQNPYFSCFSRDHVLQSQPMEFFFGLEAYFTV